MVTRTTSILLLLLEQPDHIQFHSTGPQMRLRVEGWRYSRVAGYKVEGSLFRRSQIRSVSLSDLWLQEVGIGPDLH
jgi:hypothetical protein